MTNYIFKSERLGFRNWTVEDLPKMSAINSDKAVMEFFPGTQDKKKTSYFIERMQVHFHEKGFCYFAVDKLENKEFIGFIGLAEQNFGLDFTPCIDIGWRIAQKEWGKGYATEGASKCLEFAFNKIGLENIKSMCPIANIKSEKVMQKIGMQKIGEFNHPYLSEYKDIEKCVLYEINKPKISNTIY